MLLYLVVLLVKSGVLYIVVNQLFSLICDTTAPHVLRKLPRGMQIRGVTSLDNLLYVLRAYKSSDQIEVYDKDCYRLQRKLTVHGLVVAADIAACSRNRCAYISDGINEHVHRVALPAGSDVRSWWVNDKPFGLSVTGSHSVLVTCREVSKVKEFSTDGQLLRQLQLPADVIKPRHTIQLSSGHYIACHGLLRHQLHRVCLLGSDGKVVKSYGGSQGSGSQQMNVSKQLAVDRNGFVFVADRCNHRVLLLSPELTYIREVVSRHELKGGPVRLCLDEDKNRLYVAVNQLPCRGQVVVVSV